VRRRFGAAVVLGALVALALAATGAFRHAAIAFGPGHDLASGPLAASSSGSSAAGHPVGSSLIVLLTLAGAGAVSLAAYSITQQRGQAGRVRIRTQRGQERRHTNRRDD